MENELYGYSPITERPPTPLPKGKRLAFYVGVNIEHFLFGARNRKGAVPISRLTYPFPSG